MERESCETEKNLVYKQLTAFGILQEGFFHLYNFFSLLVTQIYAATISQGSLKDTDKGTSDDVSDHQHCLFHLNIFRISFGLNLFDELVLLSSPQFDPQIIPVS